MYIYYYASASETQEEVLSFYLSLSHSLCAPLFVGDEAHDGKMLRVHVYGDLGAFTRSLMMGYFE
jgi:hypothetical protein